VVWVQRVLVAASSLDCFSELTVFRLEFPDEVVAMLLIPD